MSLNSGIGPQRRDECHAALTTAKKREEELWRKLPANFKANGHETVDLAEARSTVGKVRARIKRRS